MEQASDGLARKLYEKRWGSAGEPWDVTSPDVRAGWEEVATLARTECMRTMASNLQSLLNMTESDPEAAPYRAGIQYVVDTMQKVVDMPIDEVTRIATGPSLGRVPS